MHPIITSGGARQPVRVPVRRTVETELRHLPTSELETLPRSLRRQLAGLPVGSPASLLIGRLCRLARGELRRRRTPTAPVAPNRHHRCWQLSPPIREPRGVRGFAAQGENT